MHAIKDISKLHEQVINAALEVHQIIGPGLIEAVYQECLGYELDFRGIPYERHKELPIEYKENPLDCGYRLDYVVAENLIVEPKSCPDITAEHETKMLTYLWLTGLKEGLLINFNIPILKDGIRRVEN